MECGCGAVLWVLVVSGRTCVRAWQLAEEHGLALERQAEEHHRLEEEKKRESRSFQVSQDVLRHLHVPDKLEILNIARYQLPATCPANPTQ